MDYDTKLALLEAEVRDTAQHLASIEQALAEEYLLHIAAGKQTWQAQKMAEITHGKFVRQATAEYEIALARLRRA